MSGETKCPMCGSTQLTANKKGYSLKKGVSGMALTGVIGLLGGLFGSNDIIITCLACGNRFKPGSFSNDTPAKVSPVKSDDICNSNITHIKSEAPKAINQRLKCGSCGSLNDLGVMYCRTCGGKICYDNVEIEKNGQKFEYVYCSECEHRTPRLSKKNRYCTHCGKELI